MFSISTNKPLVALVGRKNVGKSTLFNCLSDDTKSLTLDYAGVTRDVVIGNTSWKGVDFCVADTGGLEGCLTSKDPIDRAVRDRALVTIEKAAVVLFVCDGAVGLLAEDREIARAIRPKAKNVIVVVNKADKKIAAEHLHEFSGFGFDQVISVSAQHSRSIDEIYDAVIAHVKEYHPAEIEAPRCKITLLGRPNVGKSSLMNLFVGTERSIVADLPGTTREAIAERVRFNHKDIVLVDTPGIRRKRSVTEEIEQLMVGSSLQAITNTNIILMVLDCSEAGIVDQELKLAFYVFEKQHKALMVLINKSDLMTDMMKADLDRSLEEYQHLLQKIEVHTVSCKTGKNITKVLPIVHELWERHSQRLSNADMTIAVQETLQQNGLYKNGIQLLVYRVEQVTVAPITIVLKVNYPQLFGDSHRSYIENILRRKYDLKGVPLRFIVK